VKLDGIWIFFPSKNITMCPINIWYKKNESQYKEKDVDVFVLSLQSTTVTKHNWNKLLLSLELPKHIIQTPDIKSGRRKV